MMKNYENMTATELKNEAKAKKVKNWWTLKKAELVEALVAIDKVEEVAKEVPQEEAAPKKKAPAKKAEPKEEAKDPDNIITLKELALDYGIKGSKVRRLLRNAEIERPFKRWEWDQEEHSKIVTEVKMILMEAAGVDPEED